ncbi:hypothetical protein BT63DRAFT_409118 [Microthyrium microscopicum]|uniref:von Willebrand and RING finger domain-containing protein n=1 Tax=Microthyrium microscopicum TaxID=703497 RepID=A0A6A6UVK0_9PEZI|nr:hypothetical protein BT63DRAFT_409118 [Microthyrium microscopicum]
MSSEFRFMTSGRRGPRKQSHHTTGESVKSNLEKLGFLTDPKPKDSSKHLKSSDTYSASRITDGNISRTTSRSSRGSADRPSARSSSSKKGMASLMDIDHSRGRKDRTFIGGECAVCEEQLELTLRGERILQLSCGHIAHEACFYEYLREFDSHACPICNAPLSLDSSRGGSVPNIDILSSAVRQESSGQQSSYGPSAISQRDIPSATPWDDRTITESQHVSSQRAAETDLSRNRSIGRSTRMNTISEVQHSRNGSAVTNALSAGDYQEQNTGMAGRKHDYDVQSMEASLTSPRTASVTAISAPIVTVRSEFPTLTRSRQSQSLTCLITVEVNEAPWRNDIMSGAPTMIGSGSDYGSNLRSPPLPVQPHSQGTQLESPEELERVTKELHNRVDNWHGLDLARFGSLRVHTHIRVGKDRRVWQDLDCYLFTDMLICVKERKPAQNSQGDGPVPADSRRSKCTLKGSILIRKHLKHIDMSPDNVLTLTLSVSELPAFYLQFRNRAQLELWRRALLDINNPQPQSAARALDYDLDNSGTDDEDYKTSQNQRLSSVTSSYGGAKSNNTAPTEYSNSRVGSGNVRLPQSPHVPIDIVVVIPVSSSMQGLKITLLRDALRFLVSNLGDRDRMGLVTFGSNNGGMPVVGMTSKTWGGWSKVLDSIRPVGQKSLRADVVEGANWAMDMLMQRRSANPLAAIMLISDSATSDLESVDFVVQRAEAAKVAIHSFGLGVIHKPDTMIELSTRTKASYTYIKDWMMLRECLAGVFGSLQSTSHQNVKLRLQLPEGSPAKFVKISGALHYTKRATGKDAEAALGDLRFGDKRDILVQLLIEPDNSSSEPTPHDAWESIVSGLEALSGSLDSEEQRNLSVEEIPLIQADLTYGEPQRDGRAVQLPRPSLLTITMLPPNPRAKSSSGGRPGSPPIPPHPHVVQRRMELLTSDMLTRALTLVSRGQHERAQHLLTETRSILKGLGKGGLPPLPPLPPNSAGSRPQGQLPVSANGGASPTSPGASSNPNRQSTENPERSDQRTPSPPQSMLPPTSPGPPSTAGLSAGLGSGFPPPSSIIDSQTVAALEAELDSSLEWISHPAVFSRDSRKAVLQAIGVISSQRGYTFRTPIESLWAERIGGIKRLAERAREWREVTNESGHRDPSVVMEET